MPTFTDTFTGVDGSAPSSADWIVENTTGSTSTIQSNALQMVTGVVGGYADKTILTWTGPAAADVEIDLDITPATTNESYFEFALRATNSGSSMTQNGYRFEVAFNGNCAIFRSDNFASTTLASGASIAGFGAGVTVHVQASIRGTTLTLYAWTGSTRPDTPTLQAIDATWRNAGYVGFWVLNGNAAAAQTWTVDNATIDVAVQGGRVRQYGASLPSATPYGLGLPRLALPAMSSGAAAIADTPAPADVAAGTGQALDATVSTSATADAAATGAGSAFDGTAAAGALADVALAAGAALDATAAVTVTAGAAAGTGTALAAVPAVTASADVAAGTGVGYDAAAAAVGSLTAARGVNETGADYNVKPDGVWGTFPGTYGSEWFYDSSTSITYLASRGIKFTRLPITWERIQPTRGAALNAAEVARVTAYLDACQTAGIRVVIEPHDYARYREGAYPTPGITLRILGIDLPVADIVDLWTRLATAFGSHAAVYGWELMNEPYDLFGRVDSGATFGATFDANASGWTTANGTMARSTTTVRTGAGSLQVTASGSGSLNASSAFTVSGSTTFSAYVRSNGAARSAQIDVDWWDSSRNYITSTSGGFIAATSTTWQQVTWTTGTPPAGAVWGDLVLQVLSPTAGEVFYWDDVTSGTNGSLTQATLWEDACQRCVTAIRNTGDTHRVYVPGYNWQNPITWRDKHPDPFVADPAGKITYSAHLYFDDTDDGTYAATYAQENTNAIAQGYASATDRAVSNVNKFVDWCTQFGVAGAFTELGWPHNSDATAWNATADAVYSRLDQVNFDAWVWATGEVYGTTFVLNPYDTGAGSTLSSANAQASVIEAHLGAGPPLPAPAAVATAAGAALDAATAVAATADAATGTGSALDSAAAVAVTAGPVTAAGAGLDGSVAGQVTADVAAAAGTAYDATSAITAAAGAAAVTGIAFDAVPAFGVNADIAIGTGTALDATPVTAVMVDIATGTGSALDATPAITVTADVTTGTGAAFDATISTAALTNANAGVATGTGTAFDAATALAIAADVATGTGSALAPAVTLAVTADVAPASGTALDAAAAVAVTGDVAAGVGTAYDATAATSSSGSASADVAAATAAALDTTTAVTVTGDQSTGTGTAHDAAAALAVTADQTTGTGTGLPPTVAVAVTADQATATGTAWDATASIPGATSANADVAAGAGTAYDSPAALLVVAGFAAATSAVFDALTALAAAAPAGVASGAGSAFDGSATVPYVRAGDLMTAARLVAALTIAQRPVPAMTITKGG